MADELVDCGSEFWFKAEINVVISSCFVAFVVVAFIILVNIVFGP